MLVEILLKRDDGTPLHRRLLSLRDADQYVSIPVDGIREDDAILLGYRFVPHFSSKKKKEGGDAN